MMRHFRLLRPLALGGLLATLAGCNNDLQRTTMPDAARASAPLGWQPDSAEVQLVARGIALAMQSASLRTQVLEDLRDSPFESHAIELSTYLRGTRGRAIADAAAALLGVSQGRILSLLGPTSGSALELTMPRYGDRRNWGGTANIAVAGVSETPANMAQNAAIAHLDNIRGYDVHGGPVDIRLRGPGPVPYLLVAPAQHAFGANPEANRSQAPRKSGKTIGAPEEQISPFLVCGPDCGGGGVGPLEDPATWSCRAARHMRTA